MAAINFPDNPTINDIFTVGTRAWIWDGIVWKVSSTRDFVRTVSDTAPANPIVGDEWFNTSNGRLYNFYDSYWIEIGASIAGADGVIGVDGEPGRFTTSETPPVSPVEGDAWFDPNLARLFVYYDNFWVEASPPTEGPAGVPGVISATSPLTYNSSTQTVGIDLSSYDTSLEVDAKIAALVDSAPATLDTLNELSAALGNDASFATTVTNEIASKASTGKAIAMAMVFGG